MTFGNMLANGERTLAAWCLGRGCNPCRVVDVIDYVDDVPGNLTPMTQSDPYNPSFPS
jgi:hypothetical protein